MNNALSELNAYPESRKLTVARTLSWVLYIGLILAYSIWQLTRAGGPSYLFWAVQVLPLLLVLPGMKAGNPRSYIWLCFLLIAYFLKGFEGLILPSRAWIDYIVLSISVVLFISSMFTSRWLQQYLIERAEYHNAR